MNLLWLYEYIHICSLFNKAMNFHKDIITLKGCKLNNKL